MQLQIVIICDCIKGRTGHGFKGKNWVGHGGGYGQGRKLPVQAE